MEHAKEVAIGGKEGCEESNMEGVAIYLWGFNAVTCHAMGFKHPHV